MPWWAAGGRGRSCCGSAARAASMGGPRLLSLPARRPSRRLRAWEPGGAYAAASPHESLCDAAAGGGAVVHCVRRAARVGGGALGAVPPQPRHHPDRHNLREQPPPRPAPSRAAIATEPARFLAPLPARAGSSLPPPRLMAPRTVEVVRVRVVVCVKAPPVGDAGEGGGGGSLRRARQRPACISL